LEHDASNALSYRIVDAGNVDVIFAETPFYPEGGGQLSDGGFVVFGEDSLLEVTDVQKEAGNIVHRLRVTGDKATQPVSPHEWTSRLARKHTFLVDAERRLDTARHHSATHLLHAALRAVLGDHVRQAGSQVGPDSLRFDFTQPRALTPDQITQVEQHVIQAIDASFPVVTHANTPIDDARKMGALAMFGEKYDDHVRVLEMGSFSMELCGGTHVLNTSQIGGFRITSESSVTSGVRRIEAVTGRALHHRTSQERRLLEKTASVLKCSVGDIADRVEAMRETERALTRRLEEMERTLAGQASQALEDLVKEIHPGVGFIAHNLGNVASIQALEGMADSLRQKSKGVVVLGAVLDGKAQLLVSIHPDVIKQFPKLAAGEVVRKLAPFIDGRGGGKAEFAKAGGTKIDGLQDAIGASAEHARTLLSSP
jgi:alanyl-tRNA synthetase